MKERGKGQNSQRWRNVREHPGSITHPARVSWDYFFRRFGAGWVPGTPAFAKSRFGVRILLMYEHRKHPLLERPAFLRRVFGHAVLALMVMALGLGIGVLGYHWIGGLGWVDSLLNASMILAGMGPVTELRTDAAKLFASFYALFSGVVLLGAVAMILSPVFHRIMHRFHLADEDLESADG